MKRLATLFLSIIFTICLCSQTSQLYNFNQALAEDNVRSLAVDSENNVWIGTINGVTVYDGNSFVSYGVADGIGGDIIYDILVHSSGAIYLATSGGLSFYDGDFWTNWNIGDGLPSNIIWSVEEDLDGNVWIGTSDAGVAYFDAGVWNQLSVSDGLISNSIRNILADRTGNIWFGSGNGLSIYNGEEFTNHNTSTGLPGLFVNNIIQLDNGNIAVAANGGIGIYNYHEWNNITASDGLPESNVLDISQDYEQNLVLATALGLIKYDWSNFSIMNFEDGLTNDIVTKIAITQEEENKIWCASPFDGLSVYDNNETVLIYRENENLLSDDVNTVIIDEDNVAWIGSAEGLNKVDRLHWRTYNLESGLVDQNITSLHNDIFSAVWMGTYAGISILEDEVITNITESEGLSNNIVHGITSDELGIVYVATEHSVTVIENQVVIDTITYEDGMLDSIVNNIHYENGRLWLLFDEGIQYYDGVDFFDVTDESCVLDQNFSKGICLNCEDEQYFGTDNALRMFDNGTDNADCWEHPYPGTATIISIVNTDDGVLCAFDNGEVQLFDGTDWTLQSTSFDVSFLAMQSDQYLWKAYTNSGVERKCLNCTESLDVNIVTPDCHGVENASIEILSPIGDFEYSIDNGQTWLASTDFTNLNGGYVHILVKNNMDDIVTDDYIFIDYYNTITTSHISITQIDCYSNEIGSIELFYDFPGSHEWENGNTTVFERNDLSAGTYSVTISDNASCEKVLENSIIEPDVLDVFEEFDHVTCNGDADAYINLDITGGTEPYTIEWSSGHDTQNIDELSGGNFSYTITDANGCFVENSIEIFEPDVLIVSEIIEDVFCYGEETGSIIIDIDGGTLPYNITWTPNDYEDIDNNIINAAAGVYELSIIDDNLCEYNNSYEIDQPDVFAIDNDNVVNVYCYGEETAEIEIEVIGGLGEYQFEWIKDGGPETFSTDQNLYNLGIGLYEVTITDENLCETHGSYEITQMPELDIELEVIPITCAGYEDGEIIATATGGTENYISFLWQNEEGDPISGSFMPHITGLGEGYYEVIVTDSYYCTDTASAVLTQADPHEYAIEAFPVSCNGGEDGEIIVTVNGGTGTDFDFLWIDDVAGNTNTADELAPGTYYVTVVDSNNCEEVLFETVTEPQVEVIGALPPVGYICYGESLTLDPGVFESYSWNTGAETQTIEVENPSVYIVNVTDIDGCNYSDTIEVFVSVVYEDEELNLASVTEQNVVTLIWEKTENQGTELYNIFKDSGNGFEHIASKPFTEPAIFEDTDVDTDNNYYEYRISVVDSCGNESQYSDTHRTMVLDANHNQHGACFLNWSDYEGFFVVYYFIMSGTSPDNLAVTDSTMYMNNDYAEMNPNESGTYYRLKVRRMDGANPGDGNYYNSAYSNIVYCDNITGIVNPAIDMASVYPNPFVGNFSYGFYLHIPANINITLVDMLGRETVLIEDVDYQMGEHLIEFDTDVSPGIYLLRVKVNNEYFTYRVVSQ